MRDAQASVKAVRTGVPFKPLDGDDRIHFTVLPWVSFTSFAHARNKTRAVSVPKIAFGKFIRQNERTFLPISVEVHHAMMDGLHVGRFMNRLEEMFAAPEGYIQTIFKFSPVALTNSLSENGFTFNQPRM